MPIIHLQRRLREVGRIRLGQQVATSSGKKRPEKLDRFRLTSRDEQVIRAAAVVCGGEVKQWKAPDGNQWEVITDTAVMPVVVPPGDMSFSQWFELWSAGGCQRRCDGVTEHLSERPCLCDPDVDERDRECNMTSRLNVILPEVPGFGLWRVESHGYYAAAELAGVVELCERASMAGHMLPARLRLDQRMVKRIDRQGKAHTFRFAVPVLDLDVSVSTLGALGGGPQIPVAELANEVPALPAAAGWRPVGELPEGPSASVREQLAEVDGPKVRPARANAQVPMGRSGLKPRTAAEAAGAPVVAEPDEGPVEAPASAGTIDPKDLRHLHAVSHQVWPDEEECKTFVLDLVEILDGGRHLSRSDIPAHVVAKLLWTLEQCVEVDGLADELLDREREVFTRAGGGLAVRAVGARGGGADPAPVPAVVPDGLPEGDGWRAAGKAGGKALSAVFRQAAVIAGEMGVDVPDAWSVAVVDGLPVELRVALAGWLRGAA